MEKTHIWFFAHRCVHLTKVAALQSIAAEALISMFPLWAQVMMNNLCWSGSQTWNQTTHHSVLMFFVPDSRRRVVWFDLDLNYDNIKHARLHCPSICRAKWPSSAQINAGMPTCSLNTFLSVANVSSLQQPGAQSWASLHQKLGMNRPIPNISVDIIQL